MLMYSGILSYCTMSSFIAVFSEGFVKKTRCENDQ